LIDTGDWHMGLVKLPVGNVYGVIVLALFIAVLGSVALLSIPVDILPGFKVPRSRC
jgi:hypothetical protein